MNKYGKRFWVSLIASSLVMYGLSYCWHGLFLNDYSMMNVSQGIFLAAASVVYLFISLLVCRAFLLVQLDRISKHPMVRGPLAGALAGVLMFMIVVVVGITYSRNASVQYLALDLVWQIIEQTIGGVVVGLVYMYVYEPLPERMTFEDEE
ncbi:MAG: hypothetical protein FD123_4009 [Bacteroidetes bacterium]|nr:MAG: hypothetical protein FD123_4009 [Bacteroidota bacterium]